MPASGPACAFAGRPGPTTRRRPGLLVRLLNGQGQRQAGGRACWPVRRKSRPGRRRPLALAVQGQPHAVVRRLSLLVRPQDGQGQGDAGVRVCSSVHRTTNINGAPASGPADPSAERSGPMARRMLGLLVRPYEDQGQRQSDGRGCWSVRRTARANGTPASGPAGPSAGLPGPTAR